ncbi:glycosyltransferase family 34 protein [Venturia nashicola]|uniref:Glycosyltransferase family 34 protein n=1 Tax=Venturia nashicola TaxID=86259 RepID=A0A4Z1PB07_9PEZI|nr:glycosyltransferase family 34 protein [Venturia nashicola]TLD36799.1 glycosyltransferase family 34 protein [Venturia nashicola]
MHYGYPTRKGSHSTAFSPKTNLPPFIQALRRIRKRSLAVITVAVFFLFWLVAKLIGRNLVDPDAASPIFTKAPSGSPNVVIVTTLGPDASFNEALKRNRENYAAKHGYATFFPNMKDYPIGDSPRTWSKVPAVRHAMTKFPKTPFFFYIDERTVITNPTLSVEKHITDKARLESLMIADIPVVPPDSVIKTFGNIKGDRIDLIMTQDKEGLSQGSWILRRGEWAKFMLDSWFDPLYRSYNFQKAERHALEHIVQWHGTLLTKIALIPQNLLNSYTEKDHELAGEDGIWKDGDFMVSFPDCSEPPRSCKEEMNPFFRKTEVSASA